MKRSTTIPPTHKLLSTALMLVVAAACSKEPAEREGATAKAADEAAAEADPHDAFAKLAVDDVEKRIEAKQAIPIDANSADTRKEHGTLPGAVLLSSSKKFEMSELPDDKNEELIFYCGSEKCMAAPKAAARAQEAGYTSVKVMPAGIRGWVKAGKPVDKS